MHRERFYGWVVASSSTVLIFFVAGSAFYGMPVYLVPLQGALSASRGEVARAFAAVSLLTGALIPVVGTVVDRWGPRRCLILGISGITVTHLLLSSVTTLTQLTFFMVLQGLVLPFAGGLPNQALIGRWFVKRRGRAMGMVGAGVGLGGLCLPWLIGVTIETFGHQTAFLWTSFILGGICLPIVILVTRDSPEEKGQLPDGCRSDLGPTTARQHRGLYFRHAIRLPAFRLMLVSAACSQATVGLISMHLPAMLQDAGLPLSAAGAYLGFALGIGVVGRLLVGELSDTIKPRLLFIGACVGTALSTLFLLRPGAILPRAAFVLFYGTFQGAASTVIPLVVHSLFGARAFGRIYGSLLLFTASTAALGNFMSGHIYDIRGEYTYAIILALTFGLLAAVFAFFTRYARENAH
ncbi:MAG: MFS transporter [Spirochaetaceae bacterium]|nr:MAG: MFS transporter [Spirochaetaceae bacterium]